MSNKEVKAALQRHSILKSYNEKLRHHNIVDYTPAGPETTEFMIKPINGSFRLEGFETPAQAYERAREIEAAEDDLSLAEHDLESLKEILENAPPEREEKARQGIRRGWKRRKQETKRRYTRMYKVGQQVKAKKNVVKTDEWLTVLAVDKVEWDGEEMNELTVEEPTGRTMQVFEDFIIAKR